MRSQEKPDIFLNGILTATKALLQSSCGVLSLSYGVLVGDSLRSHNAFTMLTMHALRFYGVRTALSRRLHCPDDV